MREAELPAGTAARSGRHLHVSGEHEVKASRLQLVEHLRVVAEQDREVSRAVTRSWVKLVRVEPWPAAHDQVRLGARDPHRPSPQLEQPAFVAEERRRLELTQIGAACLRVAADGDVVVAEHGEHRPGQDPHQPPQHRLAPRMREEIPADRDEIRLSLPRPSGRLPGSADPRRRYAEVEVREMGDPEAIELRRQPRQRDLELAQPHPAGFEQAPADARRDGRSDGSQASSRSSAGRGSTMWRLNFSSDSSSPAATPTSWARCRIGNWNFRPVDASSFDCHASSDRWQSGHGADHHVTAGLERPARSAG